MHRNVIIFISCRLKCSTDGISVVLYFLLSDMPDMQKNITITCNHWRYIDSEAIETKVVCR